MNEFSHVDRFQFKLQGAGVDLGDVEEAVHDLVQTQRPVVDAFQHFECVFIQ